MAEPQKDSQETAIPAPMPGVVVSPVNTVKSVAPPAPINVQATAAIPQAPQAAPPPPTLPDKTAIPEPEPEALPFEPESPQTDVDPQSITWTSSEFHNHEKSTGWYFTLAIVTIAVSAILYLLTRSILTPVVVIACGIILGVYGTHKPEQLEYAMNNQGIRIGAKQYSYDEFQLFVVTPDLSSPEFMLIPVKRFMPPLSVHYAPDLENKILGMLSDHLPLEERRPDLVDSLMRRIHF